MNKKKHHSRKSLEQAIAETRLVINNDAAELIIERRHYASRKRDRLSTVTLGEEELTAANGDDGNLLASTEPTPDESYWKEKYQALQKRMIDEQQSLTKRLDDCLEKYSHLEEYVQLLEQKSAGNDALTDQNESLKQQLRSAARTSKATIEAHQRLVEFYSLMTNMSVESKKEHRNDSGGSNSTAVVDSYTCTLTNHINKRTTQFRIHIFAEKDEDGNEMSFLPIANTDMLPQYLQAEISCELKMAPIIVGDVLQELYEDAEQEQSQLQDQPGEQEDQRSQQDQIIDES